MEMISLYGRTSNKAGYNWGKEGDEYAKASVEAFEIYGEIARKLAYLICFFDEEEKDIKST